MANNPKQKKVQYTQERSIGTFASSISSFERVAQNLSDSISLLVKSNEEERKTKKKTTDTTSGEKGNQKKVTDSMNKMNDMFGKRTMSVAGKLMGKANFDSFKKGAAGLGGKGGTGGMLGKAAGGLGSVAGGIMRAAGPIGGVIAGLKMAFDFWDSGGLAKLVAGVKMATDKGSMLGPAGIASTMKNLEGTSEFRKIDAKYAYQKPLELQQQLKNDYFNQEKSNAMDRLQFQQSLVKEEVDYEFGLRRDALQFQLDQAKESLDAELDKRKAIAGSGISFIEKYATVSERALKAIGSSTKQILEGVGKFTAIFGLGIKQSFQLSENAQGLAYHLSGSDEDVMNMTKLFSLMGKTSAETAQNLIGGFESFAKINDIAPQVIFNQIKEAGEDIYKFSNGTADSFAKQAVLLTKMSVSMSSMMKASDTMVLNYKDSIKAEMSLSAMLGKNVNLSEVRAKLMAGDQAGGASALKSALGGMDIATMNPFAKQQLTQATGMDISALMALMEGKKDPKVSGELKAEANKGKAFADAALNQDLANAGAKLKLDQEQRKKLLEFEQRQRLSMMMLEQSQKLDQIQLEAQYRAYYESKYAKEFEKENVAAQFNAEAAGNIFASKQAAKGMEAAFSSMGLDANTGYASNISSAMQQMVIDGKIKTADLAKFTPALFDALEGVDVKNQSAVEAVLREVTEKQFGTQFAAYNAQKTKEINTQFDRIKGIAEVIQSRKYMDPDYGKGGQKMKQFEKSSGKAITDEEYKLAKTLIKETQHLNEYGSMIRVPTLSLDTKQLEELRKQSLSAYQSVITTVGATTATTPIGGALMPAATTTPTFGGLAPNLGLMFSEQAKYNALQLSNNGKAVVVANETNLATVEVKGAVQKQTDAAVAAAAVQYRTLNEAEYTTKLQEEMVALLGLSTQILANIMNNAAEEGDYVTLDGKTIGKNLLNHAKKAYAVSRVTRY